jgi:hypothetical protein
VQAPLFGMQSWVNSSEVRRWLQGQIADPQTLRNAVAAPAQVPGQDGLYPHPISRHGSESHLPLSQEAGARASSLAEAPWASPSSMFQVCNTRVTHTLGVSMPAYCVSPLLWCLRTLERQVGQLTPLNAKYPSPNPGYEALIWVYCNMGR